MRISSRNAAKRKNGNGSLRNYLGDGISFEAMEAYKLLRTNLNFCVQNEGKCVCLGVTSSVAQEGKSTTSVNLAYVLAENGHKVCLIEGDMRLPTLAVRLNIRPKQGLSSVLAGVSTDKQVFSQTSLHKNLFVVTAGDVPPNPAELLGKKRMEEFILLLRNMYDYIIIDLPPITVVSDALVTAPYIDGMLMVVREGYCKKRELSEAVDRLGVLGDKFLGFAITHVSRNGKSYYHYSNYDYRKHYG